MVYQQAPFHTFSSGGGSRVQ